MKALLDQNLIAAQVEEIKGGLGAQAFSIMSLSKIEVPEIDFPFLISILIATQHPRL